MVLALVLLWAGDHTGKLQWTLTLLVLGAWLAFGFAARERVVRPLQTISNLLAALREEDFSTRARGASVEDALGLAYLEVNVLAQTLREQRLGALEATTLLRRVMEEIDVAVFAFDEAGTLRLANRAGERLLGRTMERLVGGDAKALGLAACLEDQAPRVLEMTFGGRAGRWEVRRTSFRQAGRPHTLIVLSDVSRALREEERQAWQRLIRVLGHEINNSLAPIRSVAQSLSNRAARAATSPEGDEVRKGLALIAARAEALGRFMAAYARLARLPAPKLARLDVETWVRRVAGLEPRLGVTVLPGQPQAISADGDQLDQLLINLVTNAVDAVLPSGGKVEVGWEKRDRLLDVYVRDDGPGLPDTANLFVPFFTTKPNGTGIGLALSRQIAEAHGGSLALGNRADGPGCEARLTLPCVAAVPAPPAC